MTDTNEPLATNAGLAPTEVPVAEPVRGPAPTEAVQTVQPSIITLALEWWLRRRGVTKNPTAASP